MCKKPRNIPLGLIFYTGEILYKCRSSYLWCWWNICAGDEVERVHHNIIRKDASLSYYKYNKVMNGDTIINNSIDNIDDDNDGTSGSLVKSKYFLWDVWILLLHEFRYSIIPLLTSYWLAGLTCNFIKKRHQHRCFPVNFAKFLRAGFSKSTFGGSFIYNSVKHLWWSFFQ